MGRAIVIKGADFSQVAVENTAINKMRNLQRNNTFLVADGYYSSKEENNHAWINTSEVKSGFWPVRQGDIVVFGWNNHEGDRWTSFQFCKLENNIPAANADVYTKVVFNKSKVVAIASEDCFICQAIWEGADLDFPDVAYVCDDIEVVAIEEDLQITKDNPLLTYPYYLRSDGDWGANCVTYFYPVIKGEIVTVKAGAQNAGIGLSSYGLVNVDGEISIQNKHMYRNNIKFGDDNRVVVPAGQTQQIIMPENGYMSIMAMDGVTDVFPENVTINFN